MFRQDKQKRKKGGGKCMQAGKADTGGGLGFLKQAISGFSLRWPERVWHIQYAAHNAASHTTVMALTGRWCF